jgi:hypothetical protein
MGIWRREDGCVIVNYGGPEALVVLHWRRSILKRYEAVYEHGELKWMGDRPRASVHEIDTDI